MQKKIILSALLLSVLFSLTAQEIRNDIIDVKYSKKSARRAMILSSLFPGAGQYYVDKSNLATYIFPVIEIGLWAGYLYYNSEGKNAESDYEDFADLHYNRDYQNSAQLDLIEDPENNSSFYDDHFRLDGTNTQHFYEDIGKYNKYVYGWEDWYDIYATAGNGSFTSPNWIWNETASGAYLMEGLNSPNNPDSEYYVGNESAYDSENGLYSVYRQEYIVMRKDAETIYDNGRYFSFAIVANHIASALHAVRITRKYNRAYISTSSIEFKLVPMVVNNNLSPALLVHTRF